MSPSFVFDKRGRLRLIGGASGGPTIITGTVQVLATQRIAPLAFLCHESRVMSHEFAALIRMSHAHSVCCLLHMCYPGDT